MSPGTAKTTTNASARRPVSLDHDKVVKLHKQDVGATDIARQMKCSRSAVYKVLRAA